MGHHEPISFPHDSDGGDLPPPASGPNHEDRPMVLTSAMWNGGQVDLPAGVIAEAARAAVTRASPAESLRLVIEMTVRVQLPQGFQTSEFLLEHGFIDRHWR